MIELNTLVLDYNKKPKEAIKISLEILRSGGLIAFPTETVYGLGADIWNESAVNKIFLAKDRDYSKPLAAHISSLEQIEKLSDNIPELFYKLADTYLPGPLAIVIKKNSSVSDIVTAGFKTISIRFPKCKAALDIINAFGAPLAATSANLSNNSSPTSARQIIDELTGRIDAIIDAGNVEIGVESTVIEIIDDKNIKLFRKGAIDPEELKKKFNLNII